MSGVSALLLVSTLFWLPQVEAHTFSMQEYSASQSSLLLHFWLYLHFVLQLPPQSKSLSSASRMPL